MTLCGCGVSISNPAEAVTHKDTCGEPQVNLKSVRQFEMGLDLGLDYALAVGYVRVNKSGRRRMLSAAR